MSPDSEGAVKKREQIMQNKQKSKHFSAEKMAAYILLFLMTASLLPVMYLGRYNHPTGDDYYYGAETKAVWEETGSTWQVLKEAVKGVGLQYNRWQGSYSAMLLMYLPPNIYNGWAYHLVTPVILLLLTGAAFYLLKPLVCRLLDGSTYLWLILSSLTVMLWVQTVPFQGESFFWYNGSMYYTGYFAITLFFLGMAVRYSLDQKKHRLPVMLLLAVFLAGGNYVSMLPALLILFLLEAVLLLRKKRQARGMAVVCLVASICFLINILAPGNQVRKDGMWNIPAWKAIFKSLLQGLQYIRGWSSGWLFLALFLLTPFLWKAFSKTSFRFRYPLAVTGLAYGVFCSMSCPTFYTMNSTGPARVVAIVYYSYHLLIIGVYSYLLGYACQFLQKRKAALAGKNDTGSILLPKSLAWENRMWKGRMRKVAICTAFVLLAGIQTVRGASGTTVGKAVRLLESGEAAAYEQEYQERMRLLEDARVQDVIFLPYEHQPEMLYVGDFAGDPQDETNRKAAQYFHKNSICVVY